VLAGYAKPLTQLPIVAADSHLGANQAGKLGGEKADLRRPKPVVAAGNR
jgi:hypothetical protein